MNETKPIVLTIAGLDPSGGAGILADIKTFEGNGVYGMAVCTANTCQNDSEFISPNWIDPDEILLQLKNLLSRYHFSYVKIGLIQNLAVLDLVIDVLKSHNPEVQIIWDPVMKASAGFEFHREIEEEKLKSILGKIFLLTPNFEEIKRIMPLLNAFEACTQLSLSCNVLLKGGHGQSNEANDILFREGKEIYFKGIKLKEYNKHGTGCVLSAAITASLAKGLQLEESCRIGKDYVTMYLKSNRTLLGYHNYH